MLGIDYRCNKVIENNITAIVIILGAVLLASVVLMVYLFFRLRRSESECELLMRGTEGQNFVEIVNDSLDKVHDLSQEVGELSESYAKVLRRLAGAVQHIGVVRFDAFRDLGGLLSFAVALLDDRGNGLIVSSIYGRTESRTYAKPIIEKGSKYELTPEEKEAIHLATVSREKGALPVEARGSEHEERMATLRLFHDKELAGKGRQAAEPRSQRRERKPEVAPRQEPQPVPGTDPLAVERKAQQQGRQERPVVMPVERKRPRPERRPEHSQNPTGKEQRSRGLDTPVERLRRNREPGGE